MNASKAKNVLKPAFTNQKTSFSIPSVLV